jgi:hypothetical protein
MVMRIRLAYLASLVSLVSSAGIAQVTTPPMIGRWRGEAQVFVNWTKARTIPIDITIADHDRVIGRIGDATLVDGVLTRNRGWLGRALDMKTDYIVDAGLEGPLLAAENVVRKSARMPMNFRAGQWVGSVHSSGTATGGAASMIFTASFILNRVPATILCDASGSGPVTPLPPPKDGSTRTEPCGR